MRVLVTGATGFVGSALVQRLETDLRWQVRACCHDRPVAPTSRVEWVTGADLGPDADWRAALAGVDVVIHLAARVHVTASSAALSAGEFQRVNVQGTRQLARQAAESGVRRFVFLSSVKVHGDSGHIREDTVFAPADDYGISKRDGEDVLRDIARATGLEVVIIRPPLVYGPGVTANFRSLMSAVRCRLPLPLGAIANRRSLVGVDNLVDLIVVCMDHPAAASEAFLVSDGEDVSTPELLRRLATAMGGRVRLVPLPAWCLRWLAVPAGQSAAVSRLTGSLHVDISKARRVLGWVPPVPLDEGLRRAARTP